jgi:DNA repair and recombination protein RAD52
VTLTDAQRAELAAPLDPRRVSQRQGGGGKRLNYLESHDVERTANRIFGYDGWSSVPTEIVCLGEEEYTSSTGKKGLRVGYRATVVVTVDGVQRGDTGYGDAIEYGGSRITPHELAVKEAVSDAEKRCLKRWGDQFGLVLYGDDPAPPVEAPKAATPAQLQKIRDLAIAQGSDMARVDAAIRAQEAKHGVVPAGWAGAQIGRLSKAPA